MKTLLAAVIGVTLALSAMESEAQERAERKVQVAIEQQTLADALNEWAKQTGLQLVSPSSEMLNTIVAPRVKGVFTPRGALEQLLKDTPLTYEWVSERAVAIRERSQVMPVALRKTSAEGQQQPFQMAQFSADTADTSAAHTSSSSAAQNRSVETLDEVVVTGTHIRGVTSGTPLLTFSSIELQQTGYIAPQDWIESLPQNFGSAPSEEASGSGNFNRGTGINLRGLGAGATLVLVNGRRQPMSGQNADFVDVSSIPASAIERVEVLTDGASALYGSDAIGGVVNVILRKDFDGAETRVRYASADGGVDEKTASQLFGHTWENGYVLVDYQYYDRGSLLWADRKFSASADKRPLGGSDFRSVESNPGNILDPNTGAPAFAIPAGQDGRSLEAADLLPGVVNLQDLSAGAALLPKRRMNSLYVTGEQSIGADIELFADARYSKRRSVSFLPADHTPLFVPSSNPFFVDPFGGSSPFLLVTYNFLNDFGPVKISGETETYMATAGLNSLVLGDWRLVAAVSYGEEKLDFESSFLDQFALNAALADPDPATAFNPFGAGSNTPPSTLDALRATQIEKGLTDILNPSVVIDGPLFQIPGGSAKLAIGLDYRSEHLERESDATHLDFGRHIWAAFAEVALPIVSEANAIPGVARLELSAAGRYESYSDFGNSLNPKVTLKYAPINSLQLRAAWGTSFRAPVLFDLDSSSPLFNASRFVPFFPDPVNGTLPVLFRSGGNSDLQEETATNLSFGLDLQIGQNISVSATYFDIKYEDRIATPGPANVLSVLFQADQWSSLITRDPTREQIDAVCNDPVFVGSREACLASNPAAILDFRKRNIASTEVDGLDVVFSTDVPSSLGTFGFDLNGTYVFKYAVAASDRGPSTDVLDTVNNPVSFRLRATTSWHYEGYSASLSWNHVGDYEDNSRLPTTRRIDAWNTADLRVSYATQPGSGWASGLEFALSAANLFDEEPPFVNQESGYDSINATPLGRLLAFTISKTW